MWIILAWLAIPQTLVTLNLNNEFGPMAGKYLLLAFAVQFFAFLGLILGLARRCRP
jgi:hypothetical protein